MSTRFLIVLFLLFAKLSISADFHVCSVCSGPAREKFLTEQGELYFCECKNAKKPKNVLDIVNELEQKLHAYACAKNVALSPSKKRALLLTAAIVPIAYSMIASAEIGHSAASRFSDYDTQEWRSIRDKTREAVSKAANESLLSKTDYILKNVLREFQSTISTINYVAFKARGWAHNAFHKSFFTAYDTVENMTLEQILDFDYSGSLVYLNSEYEVFSYINNNFDSIIGDTYEAIVNEFAKYRNKFAPSKVEIPNDAVFLAPWRFLTVP